MPEPSIPPASVTGRLGKVVIGAVQIYYSVRCLQHFDWLTTPTLRSGVWVFVALAVWLFPAAINLGWRRIRTWGRRPLFALGAAVGVAAVLDWSRTGVPWGEATAKFLLAATLYTHLHIGVSHLLAALIGLKGCEMRVIPYLLTRIRRGTATAELCLCPGFWTPIDRWEARWRS